MNIQQKTDRLKKRKTGIENARTDIQTEKKTQKDRYTYGWTNTYLSHFLKLYFFMFQGE